MQLEYSLVFRGTEDEILPTCREFGSGVTAYGVLSRGLLSSAWSAGRALAGGDMRAHQPRFQGDNLTRNLVLVEQLRTVTEEMGASVAQVAIAWVLTRGGDVVPLVGTRRRDQLAETLPALDVMLSAGQLARIEAAVPAVAGDRYAPVHMAGLDSEHGRATGRCPWWRRSPASRWHAPHVVPMSLPVSLPVLSRWTRQIGPSQSQSPCKVKAAQ